MQNHSWEGGNDFSPGSMSQKEQQREENERNNFSECTGSITAQMKCLLKAWIVLTGILLTSYVLSRFICQSSKSQKSPVFPIKTVKNTWEKAQTLKIIAVIIISH